MRDYRTAEEAKAAQIALLPDGRRAVVGWWQNGGIYQRPAARPHEPAPRKLAQGDGPPNGCLRPTACGTTLDKLCASCGRFYKTVNKPAAKRPRKLTRTEKVHPAGCECGRCRRRT